MLPLTAVSWKSCHKAMFSAKREIGWTVWLDGDVGRARDAEGCEYVLRTVTQRNWRGRPVEHWQWVPDEP